MLHKFADAMVADLGLSSEVAEKTEQKIQEMMPSLVKEVCRRLDFYIDDVVNDVLQDDLLMVVEDIFEEADLDANLIYDFEDMYGDELFDEIQSNVEWDLI